MECHLYECHVWRIRKTTMTMQNMGKKIVKMNETKHLILNYCFQILFPNAEWNVSTIDRRNLISGIINFISDKSKMICFPNSQFVRNRMSEWKYWRRITWNSMNYKRSWNLTVSRYFYQSSKFREFLFVVHAITQFLSANSIGFKNVLHIVANYLVD